MKIIVIGDIIEDNHYFCRSYKEIEENTKYAYKIEKEINSLGAAGNVANTICSLLMEEQVDILFFTSCNESTQIKILPLPRIQYTKHPTIVRNRYYTENENLKWKLDLRIDRYDDLYLKTSVNHKELTECISRNDIIVISDYRKGFLSKDDIKKIISIGNKNKCKILVDTIELDDCYKNCTYLQLKNINMRHYFRDHLKLEDWRTVERKFLIKEIAKNFNCNIIVTNSSDSIIYFDGKNIYSKKFYNPKQFSCSLGAGDAFLSGLAIAAYKNKKSIHDYVEIADKYATMSTTFIGTTQLVNNKMIDQITLAT